MTTVLLAQDIVPRNAQTNAGASDALLRTFEHRKREIRSHRAIVRRVLSYAVPTARGSSLLHFSDMSYRTTPGSRLQFCLSVAFNVHTQNSVFFIGFNYQKLNDMSKSSPNTHPSLKNLHEMSYSSFYIG